MVIASAERLIDVRHFWRNSSRIAEMSVPAWPMPIQKTKFVMSNAHPTSLLRPHTPMPVAKRYAAIPTPMANAVAATAVQAHQPMRGNVSSGRATSAVTLASAGVSPSSQRGNGMVGMVSS